MFTLIDEATLSDIPEVPDSELNVSMEGLALPLENLGAQNEGNDTADNREGTISPPIIRYSISPLPSGTGKLVSFYLNVVNLTSQAINQFVMLCDTMLTEEDAMIIHFNSILFCDEAETIYNAITDCKAKKKIASIPYSLNTAAFYPVLACDYVIPFKLAFHVFDVPSIRSGGDLKDAKNAYDYDSNRKLTLIKDLKNAGFINDEAYENIVERQGIYSLYGEARDKAVEEFNSK